MLIIEAIILDIATTYSIASNPYKKHQTSCEKVENRNHKGQQSKMI
jgi:hypothetical protein